MEQEGQAAVGNPDMEEENEVPRPAALSNYTVDVSTIDGGWILTQMKNNNFDELEAESKEGEILECLQLRSTNEVSDKLIGLLGSERKELIKTLIKNRSKIYYCVTLGKAGEKEKELIIDEMRRTPEGETILEEIVQKKSKHISLPNTLKKDKSKMEEETLNLKTDLKNEDIAKLPKKMVDLEQMLTVDKKQPNDKLLVP